MSALDRKLLRDIGHLRGQVVTICLVVGAGIAGFVAMQTAYRSLFVSMDAYYEAHRFADVFATARRAPSGVAERLGAIPGVALAYPRIVEGVRLPLADHGRASLGSIVSLPDHGPPPLNGVHLTEGRMPDAAHGDEALLLEHFAETHGIAPGDRIPVIMEGVLRHVRITGLAMSPEYVLALGGDILSFGPGSFAVLWMRRSAMAPGFDMEGAFNSVALRLQPEASVASVIAAVDEVLSPYGGVGAYGRDKQVSHRFLTEELEGLEVTVTFIPLIFLGVAAFLVNVVLGRLVVLQRGQIATLKAVGYPNLAVGLHFLKLVTVIVLIGSVLGLGAGAFLGDSLLGAYRPYFRFPNLRPHFDATVLGIAVLISLVAAVAGAFLSVRRIIRLPPAEAMRPPSPPAYQRTWVDDFSHFVLGPLGRMVFRDLRRRPLRTLVSSLGIALAVAIMVIGRFASDSMDRLLELHFHRAQREDLAVGLLEPQPASVGASFLAMPGVFHAEGMLDVPVKLRAGPASHETIIQGLPDGGRLRTILDTEGHAVHLPIGGLMLSEILAERLGLAVGDLVEVKLLQGDRSTREVRVAGTVSDMVGMQGYMRREALTDLMGSDPTISNVLLSVEEEHRAEVERRLQDIPAVASVSSPARAMKNFRDQQAGTMLAMAVVLAIFASIIAIGIVYNNARVALSTRSRDLSSMRVLGFTRGEISSVLLGELAVQVLLAMPFGMWLGAQATAGLASMSADMFRMPTAISANTYVYATLVTLVSALVSALLVRRKLDRLDLIGVLKTRE